MGSLPFVPDRASSYAQSYDNLFLLLTALTLFFSVVVGFFVIFFAVRYRKGSHVNRTNAPHENLKLEITWSVIPMILGLGVFAWGAQMFVEFQDPPANAMDVFAVGKQWMWHFQQANGIRENNELHVPVGKPVRITMISQDVIHALYIPAFRIQYHVVPGRYSQMWFTPTKPGKYNLWCGLYCGTQHSEMGGYVYVMPQAEYDKWLLTGGNRFETPPISMEKAGEQIYTKLNCGTCHGPKDEPRGPSLYSLFGSERQIKGDGPVKADEAYIRESILNPYNRLTAGYRDTMPVYKGQLNEEQILQLISYIKTLGQATTSNSLPGDGTNSSGGAAR